MDVVEEVLEGGWERGNGAEEEEVLDGEIRMLLLVGALRPMITATQVASAGEETYSEMFMVESTIVSVVLSMEKTSRGRTWLCDSGSSLTVLCVDIFDAIRI